MIGYAAGVAGSLDFGFGRMKDLIKDLTPDQLEATPGGTSNSIATLIIHLYGLEGRLGYALRGQTVPESVMAELLLNLPRGKTLPEVKGETAESLLAKMETARGLLLEALGALEEEDLDREMEMAPGRKVPIRFMLALLPQHHGQHFGQIQMIKKALG